MVGAGEVLIQLAGGAMLGRYITLIVALAGAAEHKESVFVVLFIVYVFGL